MAIASKVLRLTLYTPWYSAYHRNMVPKREVQFAFAAFVFAPNSGELIRRGRRVRLPHQAAQLLTILLKNAEHVVTREELRSSLWPEGENLDFDQSINRSISQLRTALGEISYNSPRYIDTLPKRGYRFMMPVRVLHRGNNSQDGESVQEEPNRSEEAADISMPGGHLDFKTSEVQGTHSSVRHAEQIGLPYVSKDQTEGGGRQRRSALLLWSFLGACLFFGSLIPLRRSYVNRTGPTCSVLIAPFHLSGSSSVESAEILRRDIAESLSTMPGIRTVAPEASELSVVGEDSALDQGHQLGADVIIVGNMTIDESENHISLSLIDVHDGEHFASLSFNEPKDQRRQMRKHIVDEVFAVLRRSNELRPSH